MSVPVSVHQPAPDRTLAVWLDSAPDLSSTDGTQAYCVDGDHQPTDLAVGGSNPSRRAPKPLVSGPVRGWLPGGRALDCDQTAITLAGTPCETATTCDHLGSCGFHCCRSVPPWRRQRVVGCGRRPRPTSTSGLAHPKCTARFGPPGSSPADGLAVLPACRSRSSCEDADWMGVYTMCRSRLRALRLLLVEHDGQQRSHRCNGAGQQLKVGGLLTAEPTIGEPE